MPSCLFSASAKSTCIPEKDVVPSWRPVSKACGRAFSEGSAPISNIGAFVFVPLSSTELFREFGWWLSWDGHNSSTVAYPGSRPSLFFFSEDLRTTTVY